MTAHWIPTSERMPEDEERVLVWSDFWKAREIGRYDSELRQWWCCNGRAWPWYEITSWMPLPEPPESAKDAK